MGPALLLLLRHLRVLQGFSSAAQRHTYANARPAHAGRPALKERQSAHEAVLAAGRGAQRGEVERGRAQEALGAVAAQPQLEVEAFLAQVGEQEGRGAQAEPLRVLEGGPEAARAVGPHGHRRRANRRPCEHFVAHEERRRVGKVRGERCEGQRGRQFGPLDGDSDLLEGVAELV